MQLTFFIKVTLTLADGSTDLFFVITISTG